MGALGYRISSACLAAGLALCAANACGGAASTPLDKPPIVPTPQGDDDSSAGPNEASASSSSGGGKDATIAEDSSKGDDTIDAGDEPSSDDVGVGPPVDASPEDASLCGPCALGNRCCTVPGTVSYGQCYSVLCGPCCF
jgi:hypothetical protein